MRAAAGSSAREAGGTESCSPGGVGLCQGEVNQQGPLSGRIWHEREVEGTQMEEKGGEFKRDQMKNTD